MQAPMISQHDFNEQHSFCQPQMRQSWQICCAAHVALASARAHQARMCLHDALATDFCNVQGVEGDVVSDALSRWLCSFRAPQPPLPGRTETEQVEQILDEKPGTA